MTASPSAALYQVKNQQAEEDNRQRHSQQQQQGLAIEVGQARDVLVILHKPAANGLTEFFPGFKAVVSASATEGLHPLWPCAMNSV